MKTTNLVLAVFFESLSELASDTAKSIRGIEQEAPLEVEAKAVSEGSKKDDGYARAREILESEAEEPADEPADEPSEGNTPADVRQLGKRIQTLIKAGMTNPSKIREALSHVGAATVANVEPESIALVWEFFAEEWAISQQGE